MACRYTRESGVTPRLSPRLGIHFRAPHTYGPLGDTLVPGRRCRSLTPSSDAVAVCGDDVGKRTCAPGGAQLEVDAFFESWLCFYAPIEKVYCVSERA